MKYCIYPKYSDKQTGLIKQCRPGPDAVETSTGSELDLLKYYDKCVCGKELSCPIYAEWTLLPQLFGMIHFEKKGSMVVLLLPYFIELSVINANRVDPDQTPRFATSDLDLHGLPLYPIIGHQAYMGIK